ncbi:hypothetical protein [Trinickia fusca]|uniref:hypothetical protein n=1 Tax=Trinickia fusca TaxID=2419777 RepID=UPI0011C392F8|nr:hypothetical protein [Trinickia fusca]
MSRRRFLAGAVHLATGSVLALPFAGVWGERRVSAGDAAILLVDRALPASCAWAEQAVRHATYIAEIVEIGDDVGMLWHVRLVGTREPLIGVLRPADGFVLRGLASSAGRTVRALPMRAARAVVVRIGARPGEPSG